MKKLFLLIVLVLIFILFLKQNDENIKIKYNDIKNDLNTGDILFFSGNDNTSNLIKKFINSNLSHCGIIIKKKNTLYLLECDIEYYYDFLSKKMKNGVRLVNLDQRIKDYNGNIFAYRKLINSQNLNYKKLDFLLKKTNKINFDKNIIRWIFSYLKLKNIYNILKNDNFMLCSQYIAYIYKKLGILHKNEDIYKYMPNYFVNKVKTINNFNFNDLIYFKNN